MLLPTSSEHRSPRSLAFSCPALGAAQGTARQHRADISAPPAAAAGGMASQVPATPAQAGLVSPSQLSFETVMQFANFMRTKSKDRQKWVRKFMEQVCLQGSGRGGPHAC